jgi:hypothetical protein
VIAVKKNGKPSKAKTRAIVCGGRRNLLSQNGDILLHWNIKERSYQRREKRLRKWESERRAIFGSKLWEKERDEGSPK